MKTKKIILAALLPVILFSCSPIAPYETKDVDIEVNEVQCSAGFAEVKFTTSKNAYFYCGIVELDSGQTKPYTDDQHFMAMQLDSANINYLLWRHELLRDNVPYIASFADHALYYGTTDKFFIRLTPGTRYFVYAFVVDIESNKPVGNLFSKTIETKIKSNIDIAFDYRVNGTWDYSYPVDSGGQIMPDFPYNMLTLPEDSIQTLLNSIPEFTDLEDTVKTPFFFYALVFSLTNISYFDPVENSLFFGIHTQNHGEDASANAVKFVEGKTYYTGIVSADGVPNDKQIAVYKFEWKRNLNQAFKHDKDTIGMYEW